MAVILAYIFFFVAASISPLQRRWLAVNRQSAELNGQIDLAFKTVGISLFPILFLPLVQAFYISGKITDIFLFAAISGICGACYFVFSFIAQRHVDAGVTSITGNIYTPVTIVLSTIFLREGLTEKQIIGTLILLFSIFLVSKQHRIEKFHFDKYFLLMILSGVMLGCTLAAERALQKTTGIATGTTLSWISQFLFLWLAKIVTKSKTLHTSKNVVITGILKGFHGLSWIILIFVVGNLSLVASVTTFKIVVVFAAAAIFLKERNNLTRKLIGSIIAIAGLLLMI